MKNRLEINIEVPCSENFNTFSATKKGGVCNSCNKEVIDFRNMLPQDIERYFQNTGSNKTCGIFQQTQIHKKTLLQTKRISAITGFAFTVLSFFSSNKIFAQKTNIQTKLLDTTPQLLQRNITVKGSVVEGNMPLPGVSILLEGSSITTSTNFDGEFQFPTNLKEGDILIFSFIGMYSKRVVITNKTSNLKVTLKVNLEMDSCILMGEVSVKKVYNSQKNN